MPERFSVEESLSPKHGFGLYWPALIVLAIGLVLTFMAVSNAGRERLAALDLAARTEAGKVARLVEVRVEQDILAIERFGARVSTHEHNMSFEEWRADAMNFGRDKPWIQVVEWADPDLVIRWVEPVEGNQAAIGLDLNRVSAVIDGIRAAIPERRSHVTGAIDLVQGPKGVITYYPIYFEDEFRGLMIGIFNVEETVTAVLSEADLRDFRITLRETGEDVLEVGSSGAVSDASGRAGFNVRGVEWEVVAAPTQAFADAVRPGAVMLAGLISLALSVLSAAALLGLQFARRAAVSARAANEGLLISEARYDLTVKGLSVGVWDWDLTDGSLYLSTQVKTMVGADGSRPDNRIDFFFERLHPEDAERVRDALNAHFEDGVPYRCEFRFRHESGRYIWCLATGQAIWDEAGEPLRMAGSVQDVTAEHIAEDLRRLSEERLRAVIENASDAVLITDIRGVITEANPACREVFGYAPEALIGQNARLLAPEELHDFQALRLNDQMRRRERGRLAGRQEFSGRKRDGTIFPVELSVTASRAGQAPIVIAIARDLTTSKAVEAEREAFIEKLETANAELERFSYAASHDLREPLRMVASFSQLLLQQHAEKLDGSALRALEICASSARRMQALLDDLLAFSRSGSDLGRIEACAPADLIGTALDHLDEAIDKSGAQIQIGEMPDTMRVNPLRFIRVFQNLVGNAVKYTPEGEAPKISIDAAPSEAGFVFTVADQGIGMNPDYADKIFEPFTRLNPSSKFDGTGMGLAICRKIIANAGGRIWVETGLGEGSRFNVYWPLTEADDASDKSEDGDADERAAS